MPYWTAIFLLVAAAAFPFAIEGAVAGDAVLRPARVVFGVFVSLGAFLIFKQIIDMFTR